MLTRLADFFETAKRPARFVRLLWDNRWRLLNAAVKEAIRILEEDAFYHTALVALIEEVERNGRVQAKVGQA